MPRVKIDYIVSFSSEDPDNPASNLLACDVSKKKWLCSKGESTCSVVLQLNKAVKICSINIGAYQSALVEVLVGRSENPNEPFQVLVPSSVFQAPSEARRAAPHDADKVRSFAALALASARAQRWDRLRLVCSQPYNKHCKFGLSFVHVFSEEDLPPAPVATLAPALALDLQSSDEDEFRPGELFAKHLQTPRNAPDTGARIRQASSHALRNIPDSSIKLTKTSINKRSPKRRDSGSTPTPIPDPTPIASPTPTPTATPTPTPTAGDLRQEALLYTAADSHIHRRRDETNRRKERDVTRGEPRDRAGTAREESRDRAGTAREEPRDRAGTAREGGGASERDRDKHGTAVNEIDERSDRVRKNDASSGNERKVDDGSSGNGRKANDSGRRPPSNEKHDNTRTRRCRAGSPSLRPHSLLADVVLVLSGYENPRRASLRGAALALGAACRRDWGPDCTHLICAFPNTPKLRSVRAAPGGALAHVVLGEWVEECVRTRRRLPEHWFATEPGRRVPRPPGEDSGHSECDTDDEIETVRRKMKKRRVASPSPTPSPARASPGSDVTFVRDERLQGSVTLVESDGDEYGGSTDEEPSRSARAAPARDARLPALFAGRCFAVRAPPQRARLLERYLQAYGGLVLQEPDSRVEYVVCETEGAREWDGASGGAVRVRAAWVWRCHEQRRVCAPGDYTLQ